MATKKPTPIEAAKKNVATPMFTFADLFAGIGGMRFAFERAGGVCTVTSETNLHARITYEAQNWKHRHPDHRLIEDVVKLGKMKAAKVPDFDVMVAGFPCQPYSIAGLRQGLADEKGRGQVFLSMLDILKNKEPKAFLLENVKGMLSHDGGRTIDFMVDQLRHRGYAVLDPVVLNSMKHGGVPQNRERVFIVGFRNDLPVARKISSDAGPLFSRGKSPFRWPKEVAPKTRLQDLLSVTGVDEKYFYSAAKYDCFREIEKIVTRSDTAYQWRRVYVRENKSGVCPALTANMGSGGHNVPLVKVDGRIRKLTPNECALLQGFPRGFVMPPRMADVHLYHQFGNSVTVPLIEKIAKEIARHL